MGTMMRMVGELGVDHMAELADDVGPSCAGELAKVFLELFGLEDSVLTQRIALGEREPVQSLCAAVQPAFRC